MWPGRIGASSFVLRYEIREKTSQRLVAEGESVQVAFDYAKNEKKPVPDAIRRALSAGPPG
jgi:acyl-CoA thioesterase FadM